MPCPVIAAAVSVGEFERFACEAKLEMPESVSFATCPNSTCSSSSPRSSPTSPRPGRPTTPRRTPGSMPSSWPDAPRAKRDEHPVGPVVRRRIAPRTRSRRLGSHRVRTREGITEFSPEQGVACFNTLTGAVAPIVSVLPIDWSKFRRAHRGRDVALFHAAPDGDDDSEPSSDVAQRIRATSGAERLAVIERVARANLGGVLRLPPATVDSRQPFGSLGLDSLMALELRNRLEIALERSLPTSLAWNYPTIEALTRHLDALLTRPRPPRRRRARLRTSRSTRSTSPTCSPVSPAFPMTMPSAPCVVIAEMTESPSESAAITSALQLAAAAKQVRRATVGPLIMSEPVAIVGMGCRFPGGANSPEAYWQVLREGVDAGRAVPRGPLGRRRRVRPRSGGAGQIIRVRRRLSRTCRPVRCRLLRNPPTRGRADGPPATAPARGRRRSAGPCRSPSRTIGRIRNRRVRRQLLQRLCVDADGRPGMDRRSDADWDAAQRARQPALLPPRSAVRACPSTRPARLRWSPSTWPATACTPARAMSPWRVVSR